MKKFSHLLVVITALLSAVWLGTIILILSTRSMTNRVVHGRFVAIQQDVVSVKTETSLVAFKIGAQTKMYHVGFLETDTGHPLYQGPVALADYASLLDSETGIIASLAKDSRKPAVVVYIVKFYTPADLKRRDVGPTRNLPSIPSN